MGGLSGAHCLRTGEGTVGRRMKKSGGRHVNHTDCEAETGWSTGIWVSMWLGSDTCCAFDLG